MEEKDIMDQRDGNQKEEIPPGYEEYLFLLQQRNRLLKKLKEKDKKQQDLERREQGFSLYLNGANVDLKLGKAGAAKSSRKAKTAGENGSREQDMAVESTEEGSSESRAWTAPSKHSRKGWGKSPVQLKIKTDKGDKIEFKTGKVTGNYSEDFEMYQSFLEQQLEEEEEIEDEIEDADETESEVESIGDEEEDDDDEKDDEIEDQMMTLTIKDVKALRRSLENNREIAESIKSMRENIESEDTDTDEDIEEQLDTLKETTNIDPSELPELGRTLPQKFDSEREQVRESFSYKDSTSSGDTKGEAVKETALRADEKSIEEKANKSPQQMISAPRKSRPLSASRTKQRSEDGPSEHSSNDVINAILQENKNVAINMRGSVSKLDNKRETRSAPLERMQKPEVSSEENFPERPISIATGSVDDGMIISIVEKVKKMNAKQQLSLLKLLSKVDDMGLGEDDITLRSSFFGNKKPLSPKRNTIVGDASKDDEFGYAMKDNTDGFQGDTKKASYNISESNVTGYQTPTSNTIPSYIAGSNTALSKTISHIEGATTAATTAAATAAATTAAASTAGFSITDSTQSVTTTTRSKKPDTYKHSVEALNDPLELIDVCFEIKSNWGHSDMVGLTEIEFFDDSGKRIRLKDENIELSSSHICYGATRNLINGKTKTNKDRYMWKCQLREQEPVKLIFHVPTQFTNKKKTEYGISKIAVWNYNKSLFDLNVGVKEVEIAINGSVVWEGMIDKGCGNQVFDYSRIINLNENESEVNHEQPEILERCKTATLVRDPAYLAKLPKIEPASPSVSPDNQNDNNSREMPKSASRPPSDDTKSHAARESPMLCRKSTSAESSKLSDSALIQSRSISTPNLSSGAATSVVLDPCKRHHQPTPDFESKLCHSLDNEQHRSTEEKSGSSSTNHIPSSKPIWLPDSKKKLTASVEGNIDDSIIPNQKPRSRPNSGRRAVVSSSAEIIEGSERGITSSRRRRDTKEDTREVDETSKRSVAPRRNKSRNQSPCKSPETSELKSSDRKRYREMFDKELEKSLRSIDQFEHSHLGRITANIDLDQHGDALDSLIRQAKSVESTEDIKPDIQEKLKTENQEETLFEIPTLPQGQHLVLNLKTTWGDRHYVGLNGIEVFTDSGELARVTEISADPADINILAEYEHDPRVISNLIDGVYMTRDDMHLWLAPFTRGGNHFVTVKFDEPIRIAMLRIWNYNKSRIHSTRGARDVEITLDGSFIFKGEIARASGILSKESEPYGDIILFTTDEDTLEAVSRNDFTFEYDIVEEEENMMQSVESERPKTADISNVLERPFTCPKSRQEIQEIHEEQVKLSGILDFTGKVVAMNFTQTWGDDYYLGLTGIQILGENFEPLELDFEWMFASPRDLNQLEDYDDDDRTLDKLIDGENVTTSDEHMWLIPFSEGEDHIVTVTFPEKCFFTGIRIWNYNKCLDDTYRGAKNMQLYIDDKEISPDGGFLLRKGPGHCHFDFAQDILFNQDEEEIEKIERSRLAADKRRIARKEKGLSDCETILLPTGFVFQLRLFSTWGDPYYIGLNGIEMYNEHGEKIPLDENNVTAHPHSVNVLEGIDNDVRTPDKLVDGVYDTYDANHMWMAPVFPAMVNVVYVVFDSPVSISMIKLWNYSKNGMRGVRQFGVLVDDLLVYNGVLPQVNDHSRAILPNISLPVSHHTMLFTDDEDIITQEQNHLLSSISMSIEQDVQMTNDNSVVNSFTSPSSKSKNIDQENRPMTSVTSIHLQKFKN